MIRYALACDTGHRFESWFRDSEAFAQQSDRHLIACPTCGSTQVAKTIMSPTVVARDRRVGLGDEKALAEPDVSLLHPRDVDARLAARAFRARLFSETQDVGRRFADEARRIHESEEPHRAIRGQATATEARGLIEDGIFVLPLPPLPDDLD